MKKSQKDSQKQIASIQEERALDAKNLPGKNSLHRQLEKLEHLIRKKEELEIELAGKKAEYKDLKSKSNKKEATLALGDLALQQNKLLWLAFFIESDVVQISQFASADKDKVKIEGKDMKQKQLELAISTIQSLQTLRKEFAHPFSTTNEKLDPQKIQQYVGILKIKEKFSAMEDVFKRILNKDGNIFKEITWKLEGFFPPPPPLNNKSKH